MFNEFIVKNFRTHIDTKLPLKDIALVIGSNSSGKSNLLAAIQHFSGLIKRAHPDNPEENKVLKESDFFPHIHRLHPDLPMEFLCAWENKNGNIKYHLKILNNKDKVVCIETINIDKKGDIAEITTTVNEQIILRSRLEHENIDDNKKLLVRDFFNDLGSIYYFNFQPALLKGDVKYEEKNLSPEALGIAAQLGKEGGGLQNIIKIVYEQEKGIYDKFVLFLRKFVDSFYGISIKNENIYWQFDLNRVPPKLEEFPIYVVSDGLLKAAAIALLASMENPPALIMLEEIENGINQKNIQHLISWLSKITGRGHTTQVIATTHNPSILREFAENLDKVFYVTLLPKGFKSVVSDLNALLINDMKAGRIEGDIVEINGKELVRVEPLELIKLFYMGVIGGI